MRNACLLTIAALSAVIAFGSAEAKDIRVRNSSGGTIYMLYAWPSDFVPDTNNLLSAPLHDGEIGSVAIDNRYARCDFTLQMDYNDPAKVKKVKGQAWSKKKFRKLLLSMKVATFNICRLDGKPYVIRNRD